MSNDCQKQHNTRFTVNLEKAGPNGSQIIFDQQPVSNCNLLFRSLSFKGKSSLKNDASYSLLVGKIWIH